MSNQTLHYQLSFWEKDTFFNELDVVIIGSGIVGLSAAIKLKGLLPSRRIVVFERGPLPIGASTRNAGFACFGSLTELIDDLTKMEESEMWALVEKRWRGLQILQERLGKEIIQYHSWGGYELFRPEEEDLFQACVNKMDAFNEVLKDIIGNSNVFRVQDEAIHPFGFKHTKHLIRNQAEGQLHPGKLMQGLLRLARSIGVDVLNGISISGLEEEERGVVLTNAQGWRIKTKQLIVATNGFANQLLPDLEVKPARNQVLITKPLKQIPFQGCFHYDKGYYYFRNLGQRILLGGGRNLDIQGEETTDFGCTSNIQTRLTQLLDEVILPGQDVEIEQWWSGILGVGDTKAPIIQKVGERIIVSVRLGGMGVAIGSLVGEEAADLVLESGMFN